MKRYILLLSLLFLPLQTFAQAVTKSDFAKIAEERLCLSKAVVPISDFQKIHELWLSNEKSELNMKRNFEVLLRRHEGFFTVLEVWGTQKRDTPSSFEALRLALESLTKEQTSILNEQNAITKADENFLVSASHIEAGLLQSKSQLLALKEACNAYPIAASIEKAVDDENTWITTLSSLRQHISVAQQKRHRVFMAASEAVSIDLQSRYATLAQVSLREIKDKIKTVFGASDLMTEVKMW